MNTTIIHSATLASTARDKIFAYLGGEFEQQDGRVVVRHDFNPKRADLSSLSQQLEVDINTLPETYGSVDIGLLISDMDSTMICIECIDEIADFMNIKEQVSTITESAMRGEIDFEESLRRRVSLLQDLSSDVLDKVYQQRLQLNPGAEKMIQGLREAGIKSALVSGGFSFFTERLQERLQLDFQLANTLEIVQGNLTGNVIGEVVDSNHKVRYLEKICAQLNISTQQAIAIGDGANDLAMLSKAGLGIAYHAKPVVQQQADVCLNFSGLDAVLDFINID